LLKTFAPIQLMQVNAGRFPKLTILMFVSDPRKRSQADGRRGFLNGGIAPFRATDQAAPANGSALSCHNAASRRPGRSNELEACFVEIDSAGQKLAYVYFEDEPGRSLFSYSTRITYASESVSII